MHIEENWDYAPPEINEPISTVVFSLDGAYILMANAGYREAMVGNLSLYDCNGELSIVSEFFNRYLSPVTTNPKIQIASVW